MAAAGRCHAAAPARHMALVGPLVGPTRGRRHARAAVIELTTVADDEAVLHDGDGVLQHRGLEPDTDYTFDGVDVRTLPRPPGERLATIATVNDVHFGETECGVLEGLEVGPILTSEPGEPPYPETMNRGAIDEIRVLGPDLVVAKGDLTTHGTVDEYRSFV